MVSKEGGRCFFSAEGFLIWISMLFPNHGIDNEKYLGISSKLVYLFKNPRLGGGKGGMVKMLGSNPFINTQGRYITNFIEIGLLVQKPPFGGERGVEGGRKGEWSIFFGSTHS